MKFRKKYDVIKSINVNIYVEMNFFIIKFVCKAINKFCIDSRVSFPETILRVINNVVMFNVFI